VIALDDRSLEYSHLNSFKLDAAEVCFSICTVTFANDPEEYVALGTAYIAPDEVEPSRGRVLILEYNGSEFALVTSHRIEGCAYQLRAFQNRILLSCNAKLELLRLDTTVERQLVSEAHHNCNILNVSTSVQGEFILVGDIMKSVTLFQYLPEDSKFQVVAQDYNAHWISTTAFLTDDLYLAADNYYNLFATRRNTDGVNEDDKQRLDLVGECHLGEFVNVICRGSLVTFPPEMASEVTGSFVFGTVGGVLGAIFVLSPTTFDFFVKLQNKLEDQMIRGTGGLLHSEFRTFSIETRKAPCRGFVDGDLIESFLELSHDQQRSIASSLDMPLEDVVARVEEMQRLH